MVVTADISVKAERPVLLYTWVLVSAVAVAFFGFAVGFNRFFN